MKRKRKLKIYSKQEDGHNIIVLSSNHSNNGTHGLLLSNTEYYSIGHNSGYWSNLYPLDHNIIVSLTSDDKKTIYKSESNNDILIYVEYMDYSNIVSLYNITKIMNNKICHKSSSKVRLYGQYFHKIENVKFKNSND